MKSLYWKTSIQVETGVSSLLKDTASLLQPRNDQTVQHVNAAKGYFFQWGLIGTAQMKRIATISKSTDHVKIN